MFVGDRVHGAVPHDSLEVCPPAGTPPAPASFGEIPVGAQIKRYEIHTLDSPASVSCLFVGDSVDSLVPYDSLEVSPIIRCTSRSYGSFWYASAASRVKEWYGIHTLASTAPFPIWQRMIVGDRVDALRFSCGVPVIQQTSRSCILRVDPVGAQVKRYRTRTLAPTSFFGLRKRCISSIHWE